MIEHLDLTNEDEVASNAPLVEMFLGPLEPRQVAIVTSADSVFGLNAMAFDLHRTSFGELAAGNPIEAYGVLRDVLPPTDPEGEEPGLVLPSYVEAPMRITIQVGKSPENTGEHPFEADALFTVADFVVTPPAYS